MAAKQSHAFRYDGVAVERHAQWASPSSWTRVLRSCLQFPPDHGHPRCSNGRGPAASAAAAERMSASKGELDKAVNDIGLRRGLRRHGSRDRERGSAPGVPRGKLAIASSPRRPCCRSPGRSEGRAIPVETVGAMVARRARTRLLRPPWALPPSPCSKQASPIETLGPFNRCRLCATTGRSS